MKKKFKYFLLIILLLVISVFVVNFYYNNNKQEVFEENEKKEINKESNKIPGMISVMLETEYNSNQYEVSSSREYPTGRYDFNAEKSGCENGGTLSWNYNTGKLVLKTRISDKCYAYFNVAPPDVTIAINNRPTTHGKLGNINCIGSNAVYNQQYNRVEILSIDNKFTTCTLNYTDSPSKVNLATYISGLVGTTQGNGQVVSENGYRYEGKNPNTYIWFNNEYWRIIGVFDSASHGVSGKNLVKIIRSEVLGGLSWSNGNTNDWTVASLNLLLNGAYYNSQDGTDSGYCKSDTRVDGRCNYTKKGIQVGYKGMIANVTWYLGSHSDTEITVDDLYGYERGTTVYEGRPTSATGYIGLMYVSDYGYGVLSNSCMRTTKLSDYFNELCSGNSWLYGKAYEWTLMPSTEYGHTAFNLPSYGGIGVTMVSAGFVVRPVLYLEASVYKISGNGTLDSPYIIGM